MKQMDPGQPEDRRALRRSLFLIAFTVGLFLLLLKLQEVWAGVVWVLDAMTPLFIGVVVAYIINLPLNFFERGLFSSWAYKRSWHRALVRPLSMVLSYILVLAVLAGLVWLVLPKVVESLTQLAGNFSSYLNKFQTWVDGMFSSMALTPDGVTVLSGLWEEAVTLIQSLLGSIVPTVLAFTVSFTSGVFDLLVAIMLSGFMLFNKERLLNQFSRLSRAVLGHRRAKAVGEVCTMANHVFGRFVLGQLTEAMILGVICFLGMQLFKMPYALVISTVIAITALIPILGPIVGTIPCAIILLVIQPAQALWFVLFIVILQQLEGNLLYPRVVGNAIGLSGLWVLASILVGGGLFGVWGMLLGVPTVAVLYRLVARWVRKKEKPEKGTQ